MEFLKSLGLSVMLATATPAVDSLAEKPQTNHCKAEGYLDPCGEKIEAGIGCSYTVESLRRKCHEYSLKLILDMVGDPDMHWCCGDPTEKEVRNKRVLVESNSCNS